MDHEPFISRVRIRNYKSIAACDVALGRLTLIVGRNGSGKSNFLDALRFIVDGLQTSLDHALKARGGIDDVRRRSTGHPHNFGIEVHLNLPDMETAEYGFEIRAEKKGSFKVKNERLRILNPAGHTKASFHVSDGSVIECSQETHPPAFADRLYLVTAAGLEPFRPIYDALLAMGFYNLNPDQIKAVQRPDAGELLRRDGSNLASVVARLTADSPEIMERITEYLQAIVPEIAKVGRVQLGPTETLEFRQEVKGSEHPWRFYASNMSDGTVRVLGILVATMQLADRRNPVRLVGIEEPETALHPAAAGALMDALREAATHTQVVVTSHSPDLVDQYDPERDDLLVTLSTQGQTEIGAADPASRSAIHDHLYSAGELLRMDQLKPDREALDRQTELVFAHGGDGR